MVRRVGLGGAAVAWGVAVFVSGGCSHESAPAQAAKPVPAAAAPAPPPNPPAPPVWHIPAGCGQNLSGGYHHRDSEYFHYQVADDGTAVTIVAYQQYGSTRVDVPDGGPGVIHLRRTERSFSGSASSYGKTQLQKICQVAWPYEVTACTATSFTLLTPHDFGLTEDCGIDQPDMAEDVLVRDGAAAADADAGGSASDAGPLTMGVPDAGASTDAGSPSSPPAVAPAGR